MNRKEINRRKLRRGETINRASSFASDRDKFDDPSSDPNVFELYVAENETLDREILLHICDLSSRIEELPTDWSRSYRRYSKRTFDFHCVVLPLRYARNLNGSGEAAERVSVSSNDFSDPVQP